MTATQFVTDKREIVNAVLQLIPGNTITVDEAMKTWWSNIRSNGGLGLTPVGRSMFELAELESYEFEMGYASSIGNLAASFVLNKKLKCPHYFYSNNKKRYVKIYDSRIAMLIALCDSVHDYLERLDNSTENENV